MMRIKAISSVLVVQRVTLKNNITRQPSKKVFSSFVGMLLLGWVVLEIENYGKGNRKMTCRLSNLNMTGGLGMKESKFYRIEYSFCYENDDDTQLVSHGWDIKSASFTDGVADINRQTFEKQCAQSASRRWLCLLKHGYKVDVEPLQRAPLTCRARIQQELHPGDLTEFDRNMWENLLTEFGDVEKRWVSTKVLKQKSEWNQLNDVNDPWTETHA
tara:strand:+ start:394 stop:1038 length:645 start_codon:yes stop_codon:yes gene_type:complete